MTDAERENIALAMWDRIWDGSSPRPCCLIGSSNSPTGMEIVNRDGLTSLMGRASPANRRDASHGQLGACGLGLRGLRWKACRRLSAAREPLCRPDVAPAPGASLHGRPLHQGKRPRQGPRRPKDGSAHDRLREARRKFGVRHRSSRPPWHRHSLLGRGGQVHPRAGHDRATCRRAHLDGALDADRQQNAVPYRAQGTRGAADQRSRRGHTRRHRCNLQPVRSLDSRGARTVAVVQHAV